MQNYWLIVVEQGAERQQYQVHQQATAALLMDLWMRRLLEPGPMPASANLYWVDEQGQSSLRVEMRFPSRGGEREASDSFTSLEGSVACK